MICSPEAFRPLERQSHVSGISEGQHRWMYAWKQVFGCTSTSSSSPDLLLFRAARISGVIFVVERGGLVFRGKG